MSRIPTFNPDGEGSDKAPLLPDRTQKLSPDDDDVERQSKASSRMQAMESTAGCGESSWGYVSKSIWRATNLNFLTGVEIVFGITLVIMAYYFVGWMTPWPRMHAHYPDSNFPYYSKQEFVGMCLYTALLPIGFLLACDGIGRVATQRNIPFQFRAAILIVLGLFAIGISAWNLEHWNGVTYFKMDRKKYFKFLKSSVSFTIFVLYVPIGLLFLAMGVRVLKNNCQKEPNEKGISAGLQKSLLEPADKTRESKPLADTRTLSWTRTEIWVTLSFIFVLVPGLWIATTLLPSDWHKMKIQTIVDSAKTKVNDLAYGANQHSNNLKIGKKYLHLYPDVYVYYIIVFSILVVGLIGNRYPVFKKIFRTIIFYSRVPKARFMDKTHVYIRLGEVILAILTTITFAFTFVFMNYYHTYEVEEGDARHEYKFSRTFGIMACMACGLLMFPISRGSSVLTRCFGISFESGVKYHRMLGATFLFFGYLHIILMLIYMWDFKVPYYIEPYNPLTTPTPTVDKQRVLEIYWPFRGVPWNKWHSDNFSIPMMYFVVIFIVVPVFTIGSLIHQIRRYNWEIFYIAHMYGALVLIIGLCWHTSNGWYFMIPGMAIQFYERFYRMWNGTREVQVKDLQALSKDVTRLEITLDTTHPDTPLGGYCFINIPHVAPLEWHPFSITNTLNKQSMIFLIKSMGEGTFTAKLNQFAAQISPDIFPEVTVNVEGPHGIDLDYKSYKSIVLVAGGIGITPVHNIFASLYNQVSMTDEDLPNIRLIWIVRKIETFDMLSATLRIVKRKRFPNFSVSLFATREESLHGRVQSGQVVTDSVPLPWTAGRPDLKEELYPLRQYGRSALIFACGPELMVRTCMEAAYEQGNEFHYETFLF